MKIIYCISGFPSMCYMTWGVCAKINLFTVACSCFVSTSGSEIQVESKILGFQKMGKKVITTFSFVSLNVYASVFIENSIVFKTVGEICSCHISFNNWISTCITVLSVFHSYLRRPHFPPVSCDFVVSNMSKTDLSFHFLFLVSFETWHPKLFSCEHFSHV